MATKNQIRKTTVVVSENPTFDTPVALALMMMAGWILEQILFEDETAGELPPDGFDLRDYKERAQDERGGYMWGSRAHKVATISRMMGDPVVEALITDINNNNGLEGWSVKGKGGFLKAFANSLVGLIRDAWNFGHVREEGESGAIPFDKHMILTRAMRVVAVAIEAERKRRQTNPEHPWSSEWCTIEGYQENLQVLLTTDEREETARRVDEEIRSEGQFWRMVQTFCKNNLPTKDEVRRAVIGEFPLSNGSRKGLLVQTNNQWVIKKLWPARPYVDLMVIENEIGRFAVMTRRGSGLKLDLVWKMVKQAERKAAEAAEISDTLIEAIFGEMLPRGEGYWHFDDRYAEHNRGGELLLGGGSTERDRTKSALRSSEIMDIATEHCYYREGYEDLNDEERRVVMLCDGDPEAIVAVVEAMKNVKGVGLVLDGLHQPEDVFAAWGDGLAFVLMDKGMGFPVLAFNPAMRLNVEEVCQALNGQEAVALDAMRRGKAELPPYLVEDGVRVADAVTPTWKVAGNTISIDSIEGLWTLLSRRYLVQVVKAVLREA